MNGAIQITLVHDSENRGKMFLGVCISMSRVCVMFMSSFKFFCTFWSLLCKLLEYMNLFKNQIQVYENTKKKRPVLEILSGFNFLSYVLVGLRAGIINRRILQYLQFLQSTQIFENVFR